MPTARQQEILRLLVDSYIDLANPISSGGLVRGHGLDISSATVRHELAELGDAGFLFRPHTSSGMVPTEQGYRYYVESLLHNIDLPLNQRDMIRHQLHQEELDEDRWIRLAAAILSRNVASLALVTPMYYQNIRLKDLDIVRISDNRAMLVQILDGGRVQRTLVHLTGEVMWPEIEKFVAEISRRYRGLTSIELQTAYPLAKDHIERQILDASINLLDQAREQYDGEPVFYGLTEVLNQPEFYTDGELFRDLLEALEGGSLIEALRPHDMSVGELRVVIGHEHSAQFLYPYGVVLASYGNMAESRGTVAVIGPTRMSYATAIPAVRVIANLLDELTAELQ